MILNLKYGKKFETNRIKNTMDKIVWYKSYNYKPLIPDCKNDLLDIEDFVNRDFNEEDYKKFGEELVSEFNKIGASFIGKVEEVTGKKLPEEVELIVTKWGSGGSYNVPNRVIINISGQIRKPALEILKHELIHLLLEEEVIKRNLSHEEKESFISDVEKLLR